MRSLPLLLSLLPGVALAGPSFEPESIELAGRVDVPLYRGPDTRFLPAVWAELPKAEPAEGEPIPAVLAVVDLASEPFKVSTGVAKAMGWKIKKGEILGAKREYTTIPTLVVGGLVVHDVLALIEDGAADLTIGASAMPGVATAIASSTGQVRFAPAAEAGALLGEYGTTTAATRFDSRPWFEYGEKRYANGVAEVVPAQILGADGTVRLKTSTWASGVRGEIAFAPMRTVVGLPQTLTTPTVGGVSLPASWVGHDGGIASPDDTLVAVLGYGALYGVDLAVDPDSNTLALRLATIVLATDPTDVVLASAKADYDFAMKVPVDGAPLAADAVDTTSGDPGKPEIMGPELGYAGVLASHGRADEAIVHTTAAVAVAGDHCEAYLAHGEALIAVGKASEAIAPLTRASELWDRWWTQDLETRTRIQADKSVADGAFVIAQPSSCFTAWGVLASAHLALGQNDAVADLYAKHADLDSGLPFAAGLALLAKGDGEAANGPLRRALNSGDQGSDVRAAIGLAHGDADRIVVLERQADRIAPDADADGFLALLPLVEGARAAGGDAAGLANRLAATDPLSVQAPLLAAREAKRAGDTALLDKQLAALPKRIEAFAARYPNSDVTSGYRATLQALQGDTAGATATLDAAQRAFGASAALDSARLVVATISGGDVAASVAALRARNPLHAVGFVPAGG